jgi:hypothetical protein
MSKEFMMKKYICACLIFTYAQAADLNPSAADISSMPTPQDITAQPAQPTQQTQPSTQTSTTPSSQASQKPQQKPKAQKKSKALFTVGQITSPYIAADGSPIKKTEYNRYDLQAPVKLTSILTANSNTFGTSKAIFQNYPPASLFFPRNTTLASSFSGLINEIKTDQVFFLLVKRMHSTVLQQLYAYFKKIYVVLDLTFVNSTQDFVTAQLTYGLNTKKLIVHHLLNIVDGQSYQFSQTLFPNLDKNVATHTGSSLVNNDRMINLSWLTSTDDQLALEGVKDTKLQQFKKWQQKYLALFKHFFSFFKQFTMTIDSPDPAQGSLGISQLATYQQDLRTFFKNQAKTPISPQFFFPTSKTIQAITMIPKLAKNIPAQVKSVPWPTQIVQAARAGTQPTNSVTGSSYNFPLAFFKDATGKETTSSDGAQGLYMNMFSGGQLYEIELLAQPSWLNDQHGIINMVRGALGDFSALVGLNILDSDTEAIIKACLSARG